MSEGCGTIWKLFVGRAAGPGDGNGGHRRADTGRQMPHWIMAFWAAVVGVVVVLLVVSWVMDRGVRRRGSGVTFSGDISAQAREGRRDAEILANPMNQDISWSSWSRRNGRR